MMSFFKSLILSIGISVMVFGCGGSKHSTNTVYGERMMNSYVMENVTQRQVDSICVADSLPNFNKWVGSIYVDFETRQTVDLYENQRPKTDSLSDSWWGRAI